MPPLLDTVLKHPTASRVRRNHGLEHAVIHILSQKFPRQSLAGHSDMRGFWIFGDIETDVLEAAIQQGLDRLRAGEHDLAIHPNCGTNYVTTGTAAGLAGAFAMLGSGRRWRDKLERLPLAMALATLALILTQPLGFLIQKRVTTSGNPGDLEVVKVIPSRRGRVRAHRVVTRG